MAKEFLFSISKKDLKFQAFMASGPGGQHRNRTLTAIRLKHLPSGAVVENTTDKSQHRNKIRCLYKLKQHPKFKFWIAQEIKRINGEKSIEQKVEEMMDKNNIRIEIKDENDKWIEFKE